MSSFKRFFLTNILFLKVIIAFSLGIICTEQISSILVLIASPIILAVSLYTVYHSLKIKRSKIQDILFFCLIFSTGILFHSAQLFNKNSSLESLKPVMNSNNIHWFRLDEKPIMKANSIKLEGKLIQSNTGDSSYHFSQKIVVYLPKDAAIDSNYYGQIYQIKGKLVEPSSTKNDFEFDYKKWLNRKGFYATIYSKNITPIHRDTGWFYSLRTIPLKIRDYYEQEIDKYILEPNSNDIAKSILIGVRTDIDREMYEAYADTGTIHILSVSGLHFGILILFLNYILSFFIKNERMKFIIKHSISIIYALMTGFSPPVMRSFLMFLFFDIEKFIKSKTSSFNIVFLTAWLILLFDTNQLFDIGFQLSYIAILGIMLLYNPILWKLEFKSYIPNLAWKATATMFSAWICTAPLIIFYFHKVSLLGMLSNYFILPITTITMYLGFILMIFSKIKIVATFIGTIISWLILWQNNIIIWFSNIKLAMIYPIHFTNATMISSFVMLLFFIFFLRLKDKYSLRLFLISTIACLSLYSFSTYQIRMQREWYLIPSYKYTGIAYKFENEIHIFSDSIEPNVKQFFIKDILAKTGIDSVIHHELRSYFINQKMKYGIDLKSNPQYLVLCNENKENWESIIRSRDSFALSQNLSFRREEVISLIKSNKKFYFED